jgi:membrane protease YdiL (CAAX protease family)
MADPSMIERVIDPVTYPPGSMGSAWVGVVVAALVVVAGLWLIQRVLRGFGAPAGTVSRDDTLPAVLLAIAIMRGPPVGATVLRSGEPLDDPWSAGAIQPACAAAGVALRALRPGRTWAGVDNTEAGRDWAGFRPGLLPRTLLVWVLGYPVLQAGLYMSVVVLGAADVTVVEQSLVTRIRDGDSLSWIVGWYLMAAIAAPLAEEFVFRVVLFGSLRAWLTPLGRAAPWIAGAASVSAFVAAHAVWSTPVIFLPLTCLAVVLTLVFAYSRSMWPCVVIHGLHNGLVVTLQLFVVG